MEYAVKIKEVLVKLVKTDANTEDEARKKARKAYLCGKVVLGGDDYVYHEIEVMPDGCDEYDPSSDGWEKID